MTAKNVGTCPNDAEEAQAARKLVYQSWLFVAKGTTMYS